MSAEDNPSGPTDTELKEALQGKTLHVYLLLIDASEPVGPREVQRKLDYSSVNVAVHHLEKLSRIGLAIKDEHGRYLASKRVSIGIMELFMNVGRVRFPRLLFYAAFFAALSIMYFVSAPVVVGKG